nr:thioredoxin family protein [Pedobacter panaciterrae]
MAIKILFINLLIFSSLGCLNAQTTNLNDVKFSGQVLSEKNQYPDSIIIMTFFKDWMYTGQEAFKVMVDSNGKFDFRISKITKPTKIRFSLFNSDKRKGYNEYYIEPGDDVKLQIFRSIKRDSFYFAGKGSSKYNLTEKLNYDYERYKPNKDILELGDTANFQSKLALFYNLVKHSVDKKLVLIKTFDPSLSNTMKNMLKYEYANYYESWATILTGTYIAYSENSVLRSLIRSSYNLYRDSLLLVPNEISILCPRYIVGFSEAIKMSHCLNDKTDSIELNLYYNKLKNTSSGAFRERLLAEFFISPFALQYVSHYDQNVYDSLVVDASKFIISPILRQSIAAKVKLRKNAKIYTAGFVDLNDKEFRIESLKGKIFLIDIWGDGCVGCAEFHRMFDRYVYPLFKANKNFVVLSINADKKKDTWIKAINSGIYTSRDYLNVSFGALDGGSAFLSYYNMNAYPFLLLVDEHQRIYSKFSASLSAKELIIMINGALDQTISK